MSLSAIAIALTPTEAVSALSSALERWSVKTGDSEGSLPVAGMGRSEAENE